MPHPAPLYPGRTFLVESHDAVSETEKTPEKRDIFCLLNTPRLKYGGHQPEQEHKGPLGKIISKFERLRNLEVLPESFNFEGPAEEVFECSFDIVEKQCGLIARETSCWPLLTVRLSGKRDLYSFQFCNNFSLQLQTFNFRFNI